MQRQKRLKRKGPGWGNDIAFTSRVSDPVLQEILHLQAKIYQAYSFGVRSKISSRKKTPHKNFFYDRIQKVYSN